MCLCMIDKRLKKKSTVREAWKVFRSDPGGKISFLYQHSTVKRGEWLQAVSHPIIMSDPPWPRTEEWTSSNREVYYSGFHVFTHKKTALEYAGGDSNVYRVFVRGVRLVGRDYKDTTNVPPLGPTLVADEMFVP